MSRKRSGLCLVVQGLHRCRSAWSMLHAIKTLIGFGANFTESVLVSAGNNTRNNLQVKGAFRLNTRLGPEIAAMTSKMNKKEQVRSSSCSPGVPSSTAKSGKPLLSLAELCSMTRGYAPSWTSTTVLSSSPLTTLDPSSSRTSVG